MEENIICPRCKECELEKHKTGLLEIYFLNDVLCLSLNELKNKIRKKEQATRQFEFHYIKCPKCEQNLYKRVENLFILCYHCLQEGCKNE